MNTTSNKTPATGVTGVLSEVPAGSGATLDQEHPGCTGRHRHLRFHPRRKGRLARLPFVGSDHGPSPSFWDVPLTGGYIGGTLAGEALAKLFLAYLDESDGGISARNSLGWIVNAWVGRALSEAGVPVPECVNDWPEWYESLSGQIVGFLSQLQPLLIDAARVRRAARRYDPKALLACANSALGIVERQNWSGIVAEGAELGLAQGSGETCPAFKARVFATAASPAMGAHPCPGDTP